MESFASQDLEDYWNEVRHMDTRSSNSNLHSEEDSRSHEDDGESDEAFLEELGLPLKDEVDEEKDEHLLTLLEGLSPKQAEVLRRRVRTYNRTLRSKKRAHRPDMRQLFTDTSSTGTRSRSATPDSLDSVSPPRTPPDPKAWSDPALRHSAGSLDSGNHSLVAPPLSSPQHSNHSAHSVSSQHCQHHFQDDDEDDAQHCHYRHSHKHHSNRHSSQHHSSSVPPPPPSHLSSSSRISAPTSFLSSSSFHQFDKRRNSPPYERYTSTSSTCVAHHSDLSSEVVSSFNNNNHDETTSPKSTNLHRVPSVGHLQSYSSKDSKDWQHSKELRRQRSYARDLARDVKSHWGQNKQGLYAFKHYQDPPDIQVLAIRNIGTLHIPRCKEKRSAIENVIPSSEHTNHPPPTTNSITDGHILSSKDWQRGGCKENRKSSTNSSGTSSSTIDLGFKILNSEKDEEFPEARMEVGRGGLTRVDWLGEKDAAVLATLALLELDSIFAEHEINHHWRKNTSKKKKSKEDKAVFGVCVDEQVDRDRRLLPDLCPEECVPLLLCKLRDELEERCLHEEGILRVPGQQAKVDQLKHVLDLHFYVSTTTTDSALHSAAPSVLAALVKVFLRELPEPLLTHRLMYAFYKTHRIKILGERILALKMLVLALPCAHRDTLRSLLDLCGHVVQRQQYNKMSLYNVAMILAPNLFLPKARSRLHLKNDTKDDQLNHQMAYAGATTSVTQCLIQYRDALWTVPPRLLTQVRQHHIHQASRSSGKMRILLPRRTKEDTSHLDTSGWEATGEAVIRVSVPLFGRTSRAVKLDPHITVGDLILRVLSEAECDERAVGRVEGRRELQNFQHHKSSAVPFQTSSLGSPSWSSHLRSSGRNHPCLLGGSAASAVQFHALHEQGGNIGERRLDHQAKLIAVYQDNPLGHFVIKCHHGNYNVHHRSNTHRSSQHHCNGPQHNVHAENYGT
ncbi:uncharacterized protein LOC143037632 [Oratosquilla oratoria]|uniref:uncharacterized protein LOC143037632 n=1 Tax=Oratosquilla oratoria TaxID=337810 RepID=UPI003F7694F8